MQAKLFGFKNGSAAMGGKESVAEAVKRGLAAAADRGDTERLFLRWRGKDSTATVVSLPVDIVFLNPRSHRIRAQLESSPDRELVELDPFGMPAQSAIEEFLRKTENFRALKQNLRDVGQTEPGLVTASGMLVNANTRCVALRDIGERYIRVGVLPSDASDKDVDDVELSLQMRRDFRSEYSFTNELLFIDDLLKIHKLRPEDVATEMGWASRSDTRALKAQASKVVQQQRILSLIRELQAMSGGQLKLVDFDSRRQALSEIDSDTHDLGKSDPDAAAEISQSRLAAMLLDVGYRELRHMGKGFVTEFLVPVMEDQKDLKPYVDLLTRPKTTPSKSDLEGLDVLDSLVTAADPPERTAEGILEAVTSSIGRSQIILRSEDGGEVQLGQLQFVEPMRRAFETAAADAELTREAGDRLNRPIDLLRKAVRMSKQALDAFGDVKADPGFDNDRMRRMVGELANSCENLRSAMQDQSE